MCITCQQWCDVLVFTKHGHLLQRNLYNTTRCQKLVDAADAFMHQYLTPNLFQGKAFTFTLTPTTTPGPVITPDQASMSTPVTNPATISDIVSTSASQPHDIPNIPEPVSKKSRRGRKKRFVLAPTYICGTCGDECLHESVIKKDGDNSVGCDTCQLWFHWKCVSFHPDIHMGDWFCSKCQQI